MITARRPALLLGVALVGAAAAIFVHGGYDPYAVRTGSMLPSYRPGDLVIDRPTTRLLVGDVISFRSSSGPDAVVTHRIVEIDGKAIRTQGDANTTPDPWTVAESDVLGRVVRHVPHGGYALFYLKQPAGVASILLILMGLVLAWRICFPTERAEYPHQEEEAFMKIPQMAGT
jgi:signal peptidase